MARLGDEAGTPNEVLERVRRAFGGAIELDPASTTQHNERVQAERFWTKEDDALSKEWKARTVFLNGPFSSGLIMRFTQHAIAQWHAGNIGQMIKVTNSDTSTKWSRLLFSAAVFVCFPYRRISFVDVRTEKVVSGNNRPQTIWYFGHSAEAFRSAFDDFGTVVNLHCGTRDRLVRGSLEEQIAKLRDELERQRKHFADKQSELMVRIAALERPNDRSVSVLCRLGIHPRARRVNHNCDRRRHYRCYRCDSEWSRPRLLRYLFLMPEWTYCEKCSDSRSLTEKADLQWPDPKPRMPPSENIMLPLPVCPVCKQRTAETMGRLTWKWNLDAPAPPHPGVCCSNCRIRSAWEAAREGLSVGYRIPTLDDADLYVLPLLELPGVEQVYALSYRVGPGDGRITFWSHAALNRLAFNAEAEDPGIGPVRGPFQVSVDPYEAQPDGSGRTEAE